MRAAKRSLSAMLAVGAGVAVLTTGALSLLHPWGNLRSKPSADTQILAGASAPDAVKNVLANKCGDCHSNNTRWPAYSNIAPASWLVEHDVHTGRQHMNLSQWQQYSIDNQIDLLGKMATEIRQGKMPLKQYVLLHPDAKLSAAEQTLIRDWSKSERKRLMNQQSTSTQQQQNKGIEKR